MEVLQPTEPRQEEQAEWFDRGPEDEAQWVDLCNSLIDGSITWSEFVEEVEIVKSRQESVVGTRFRRGRRFGGESSAADMDKVRTNVLKTTMAARKRGLTEMPAVFEREDDGNTGPGVVATLLGKAKRGVKKVFS